MAKITIKDYECTKCGFVKKQGTNHYGNTWSVGHYNCCPECPPYAKYPEFGGQTLWKCIEEEALEWWVNTYLTDRAYGGPEEGGWYYDCGEVKAGFQCETEEDAQIVKEEMIEVCIKWNEDRPDISSVLSEGRYFVCIENTPPENYPQERPHYE